jgi:YegS/Rv2252/BmrU family lipid kinase
MAGGKSVAVVLNGISLRKKEFYKKILPALEAVAHVEVLETHSRNDALQLAAKAGYGKYDAILAAGGDGTLHQVVNGLLQDNENAGGLPPLGLIPLGSGNDFARTLNLSAKADAVQQVVSRFRTMHIDIGKISFVADHHLPPRYFINIADTGLGPQVVQRVLASGRPFGSVVQYYVAIVHTFFTHYPEWVSIKTPLWKWEGEIRSLAIANGKFFGNGICIAPDAVVDDGKFSCFIAGKVSVMDFIIQNGRLRKGKRAVHAEIAYREAEQIELSSKKPLPIEADGELVGHLPVRIELLPKRLQILC